jgi:hypothetical protein
LSLRHCYCVPRGSETSSSTIATKDLLAKVEANLRIPYETKIFDDDSDHKEKLVHMDSGYPKLHGAKSCDTHTLFFVMETNR